MAPLPEETCVLSKSWLESPGTVTFSGGSQKVLVAITLAHPCHHYGSSSGKISRSVSLYYSNSKFYVERFMLEDVLRLPIYPPQRHHSCTSALLELASSVCGAPLLIRRPDLQRRVTPYLVPTMSFLTDLCHGSPKSFSSESCGAEASVSPPICLIAHLYYVTDSLLSLPSFVGISSFISSSLTLGFMLRIKSTWTWPFKADVYFEMISLARRFVDYDPKFMCWWSLHIRLIEAVNQFIKLPTPRILKKNLLLISVIWVCVVSLRKFDEFNGFNNLRIVPYVSFLKILLVGSPSWFPVSSSSFIKESTLQPCLFSMKGDVFSGLLPSYCFSLLAGLSSCVAVCTGSEDAIENTSVFLVGESWFSTSYYVTILQLFDFVVKAHLTHSSFVSNSLSPSEEDLSDVVSHVIVLYAFLKEDGKFPLVLYRNKFE